MLDIVEFNDFDVIVMSNGNGDEPDSGLNEHDILQKDSEPVQTDTIHEQVEKTETPLNSSESSEDDTNDAGNTNVSDTNTPDDNDSDNDTSGNDAADEAGESADEGANTVEESATPVETDNTIVGETVQPEEVLDNSGAEDTVGE